MVYTGIFLYYQLGKYVLANSTINDCTVQELNSSKNIISKKVFKFFFFFSSKKSSNDRIYKMTFFLNFFLNVWTNQIPSE